MHHTEEVIVGAGENEKCVVGKQSELQPHEQPVLGNARSCKKRVEALLSATAFRASPACSHQFTLTVSRLFVRARV